MSNNAASAMLKRRRVKPRLRRKLARLKRKRKKPKPTFAEDVPSSSLSRASSSSSDTRSAASSGSSVETAMVDGVLECGASCVMGSFSFLPYPRYPHCTDKKRFHSRFVQKVPLSRFIQYDELFSPFSQTAQ